MSNSLPLDRGSPVISVLLELAARCETEEPGSNLDRDIRLALHGLTADEAAQQWMPGSIERIIPAFTTSLDAAVTLVPEGWVWRAGAGSVNGWADVAHPTAMEEGTGSNAALALCAAALRARAHGVTP